MVVLKKRFFDVKLELLNTIVPLLATKPEALEGSIIKFDLTKLLKGKGSEARFVVKRAGEQLIGQLFYFSLYPSYIRRLIGHDVSIVEDSFVCKTKNAQIRIKPFLITRKKVHRAVRAALRNAARDFLKKTVATKTRDRIFQSVLAGIMQRMLSAKLKKIYPLAVCELRVVRVENLSGLMKK